jgi:hypothetical protein
MGEPMLISSVNHDLKCINVLPESPSGQMFYRSVNSVLMKASTVNHRFETDIVGHLKIDHTLNTARVDVKTTCYYRFMKGFTSGSGVKLKTLQDPDLATRKHYRCRMLLITISRVDGTGFKNVDGLAFTLTLLLNELFF